MCRRRWLFLLIALPLYTAIVAELGWIICTMILGSPDEMLWVFRTPDMLVGPFTMSEGRSNVLVPAIVLTVTQFVFLLPVMWPRRLAATHGRSLALSVAMSGFCGAMLTAGLLFAVVEAIGLLRGVKDPVDHFVEPLQDWAVNEYWTVWPFVLVSWVLWTPLLIIFARRRASPRLLSRVVTYLFAGTVVEVLIVVPLDIMVRRRTNCYCGTGTAIALCFSVCSLLWLSGPGVVLAATSKRRRWWIEQHCEGCGYQKGPSPGAKCPECGCDWHGDVARPA